MITTFALLCQRCGLSQREAADFLVLSPSQVDKMSTGKRSTPPGIISEIRGLYAKIERAADAAVDQYRAAAQSHGVPDEVELALASDDHEARSLGWPCVGAQAAMLGIVAAALPCRVKIVPRGSTSASAAAADAHDKARPV